LRINSRRYRADGIKCSLEKKTPAVDEQTFRAPYFRRRRKTCAPNPAAASASSA
jgi:hypothetical protein